MVVRVHTIRFGFDKTSIVTFGATSFTLEGSVPIHYWSCDKKRDCNHPRTMISFPIPVLHMTRIGLRPARQSVALTSKSPANLQRDSWFM